MTVLEGAEETLGSTGHPDLFPVVRGREGHDNEERSTGPL